MTQNSIHPSVTFPDTVNVASARQDPLHRFSPTPYATNLKIHSRTVRIEANLPEAIDETLSFFERHQYGGLSSNPEFLWRLVYEIKPTIQSTAVPFAAFSGTGTRYVNIGQHGFVSVDLRTRTAVAYLAEPFLKWEPQSGHRCIFDLLFCLTASSLGLTMLSAGCVGMNGRAALVLGPPNSGKTTSCYLAAKEGSEFYADQLVFLGVQDNSLRVWGDFLPAVFRPEALRFDPELRTSTLHSTYGDLSFHFLEKRALQSRWAEPAAPAFSLFLDRGSANMPRLTMMDSEEFASLLRTCLLFEEDSQFGRQIDFAIKALASRPAFKLQYDQNPATAAHCILNMLKEARTSQEVQTIKNSHIRVV